jgi:hypothetical protein
MAFTNLAAIVGALALFEVYLGHWQPEAQPHLLQRVRELFAKVRYRPSALTTARRPRRISS